MMRDPDKFRGCLLGGAAGDALGYEVEFMDASSIFARFGSSGITEYVLHDGVALISDDTQMTLFTADALLREATRGKSANYTGAIADGYRDWLRTQQGHYTKQQAKSDSWLTNIPGLYSRRAPGMTCLHAIESGCNGRPDWAINNSKGCGGVMRVAPIGLYFVGSPASPEAIDRLGAEAAALTHGHELGYLPAAMLVHIIHYLVSNPGIPISNAVDNALAAVEAQFPNAAHMPALRALILKAKQLAWSNLSDLEAIGQLGEGWVAEETLAIAVYCALKYKDDFDKALIAAVNHSGDSDSTGAVTGNILGASLGLRGIPDKYLENLELRDLIVEVADDLCRGVVRGDPVWDRKYVDASYGQFEDGAESYSYAWQRPKKSLEIRLSSITDLKVDCVVNAANRELRPGGGVCGAIFTAAGMLELQSACEAIGSCPTGEAVITPGFRLKADYIVHAVGPIWRGGTENEKEHLYSCYSNALRLAHEKGCRSIAFPLISAGTYRYPVQDAWRVAVDAILNSPYDMDVTIAVINERALAMGNSILCERALQNKENRKGN